MFLSSSNTSRSTPVVEKWQQAYAGIPMSFEPDAGQGDSPLQFKARGDGYDLLLTPTEAVLTLSRRGPDAAESTKPAVLRMRLDGANANPGVRSEDELPGKVNYFI